MPMPLLDALKPHASKKGGASSSSVAKPKPKQSKEDFPPYKPEKIIKKKKNLKRKARRMSDDERLCSSGDEDDTARGLENELSADEERKVTVDTIIDALQITDRAEKKRVKRTVSTQPKTQEKTSKDSTPVSSEEEDSDAEPDAEPDVEDDAEQDEDDDDEGQKNDGDGAIRGFFLYEIKDITVGTKITDITGYTKCSHFNQIVYEVDIRPGWINYHYTDTFLLQWQILQLQRLWRLVDAGKLYFDSYNIINVHMYFYDNFNDQCVSPIPIDTGLKTLPIGNVLLDWQMEVGYMGSFYMQEPNMVYTQCAPGTWMTCTTDTNCEYILPRLQDGNYTWTPDSNSFQVPSAASPILPIAKCYDCVFAASKNHYSKNPNKCSNIFDSNNPECNNIIADYRTFGNIYCPGNGYTPLICPAQSVASSDRTRCICQDGYYNPNGNDASNCVICPPGHYCVGNNKYVCADGTYQNFEGKTECQPCDVDGNPVFYCSEGKLPAKCTLANDPVNFLYLSQLQCVPCSQCKNAIIQSALPAGSSTSYLDCYNV